MINRRPGGLQQTNYSLPPLFKEKELEFPKASPSKFTPPTVGVQPNYSGGNRIDIDFPNTMRTGSAVKSSVGETLRGGSSYLYGGSQYKAGRGFVRSQNEEPIDTMDDPGIPGPLNGSQARPGGSQSQMSSGQSAPNRGREMTADEVRNAPLPRNTMLTRAARSVIANRVAKGKMKAYDTRYTDDPYAGPSPF